MHGDIRLGETDDASTSYAYLPQNAPEGGDVWFNHSQGTYDNPVKGGYAFMTFLHELGHSIGLKHGHETSGQFGPLPYDHDSMEYSVMTYRSYVGGSVTSGYTNETWGYAQSLMQDDIAAVQAMYGADFTTNSGDTTYTFSPTTGEMFIDGAGQGRPGGNQIFLTIWDGGGNDTYDLSNYSGGVTINLNPGAWTTTSTEQIAKLRYDGSELARGNIANALLYRGDTRSLIEDAIGGSGNDKLTGNVAANRLDGGAGADTLKGGQGADFLYAGKDDASDIFIFTSTSDSGTTSSTEDRIYQFDRQNKASEKVSDHIDLTSMVEDSDGGDAGVRFVSKFKTASASQPAAQVTIDESGKGCKILIDVNGDKQADMIIHIMDVGTLTKSDFLL